MSRRELVLVAWISAAFAGLAVAGFAVLPSVAIVWIVLIVFAAFAIPQALIRRTASRRRTRDHAGARETSGED